MRLVIVRHGETDWSLAGRYTGSTDVDLTANGRAQAAALGSLLQRLLHAERAVLVSSPRKRATETATLALPAHHMRIEPLVAEYDYGNYEGLTTEQIRQLAPGWDIWRDGCPDGESTAQVGRRADAFLHAHTENRTQPVIVVTHGHFSRILAARALGLTPEHGQLFASTTAAVSLIEDHHGERCVGLWNADTALLAHAADPTAHPSRPRADPPVPAGELLP
ncbi:MAG: histidine phosphatase family protein [Dermatophilaceae bacterium]